MHYSEVRKVAWTPFSELSPSNDLRRKVRPGKNAHPPISQSMKLSFKGNIRAGALRCPDSKKPFPRASALGSGCFITFITIVPQHSFWTRSTRRTRPDHSRAPHAHPAAPPPRPRRPDPTSRPGFCSHPARAPATRGDRPLPTEPVSKASGGGAPGVPGPPIWAPTGPPSCRSQARAPHPPSSLSSTLPFRKKRRLGRGGRQLRAGSGG